MLGRSTLLLLTAFAVVLPDGGAGARPDSFEGQYADARRIRSDTCSIPTRSILPAVSGRLPIKFRGERTRRSDCRAFGVAQTHQSSSQQLDCRETESLRQ